VRSQQPAIPVFGCANYKLKEVRENALRAIMKRAECREVIIKEWSNRGAVQDDEEKEVVKKQKTLGNDHAIKT
jgi:hypothetical protein